MKKKSFKKNLSCCQVVNETATKTCLTGSSKKVQSEGAGPWAAPPEFELWDDTHSGKTESQKMSSDRHMDCHVCICTDTQSHIHTYIGT